jgi:hypothetical protein
MTDPDDGRVTLNAQEAREGKKLGSVRYVLGFSLALAILAGVIVWTGFFG